MRWWDGSDWTEHRELRHGAEEGVEQPPPATGQLEAALGPLLGHRRAFWVAGGALVAIIIGSLGTWVRAAFVSASGMDGDGVWFLIGALLGLGSLWGYAKTRGRGALIFPALLAVGVGLDSVRIIKKVEDASHTTLFGHNITIAQVGWGLWVTTGAAVVLLLACLLLAFTTIGSSAEASRAG